MEAKREHLRDDAAPAVALAQALEPRTELLGRPQCLLEAVEIVRLAQPLVPTRSSQKPGSSRAASALRLARLDGVSSESRR